MWLRRSTFLIPPELNSRNPYNRQLSSSSGGHQASSIDDSQVSLGKWTARAFLDPLFSSPPPSSASPTQAASDFSDPLPARILASMLVRVSNDVVVFVAWAVLGFAVHVSTVFTVPYFQPFLPRVLIWIAIVWGCILHYIWPQLRKYPILHVLVQFTKVLINTVILNAFLLALALPVDVVCARCLPTPAIRETGFVRDRAPLVSMV